MGGGGEFDERKWWIKVNKGDPTFQINHLLQYFFTFFLFFTANICLFWFLVFKQILGSWLSHLIGVLSQLPRSVFSTFLLKKKSLKLVSFLFLLAKFQIFREIWASVSSPSFCYCIFFFWFVFFLGFPCIRGPNQIWIPPPTSLALSFLAHLIPHFPFLFIYWQLFRLWVHWRP